MEMVVWDYSTRFVNVEENGYRFEGLRKETWVNARPALLIAVWEGMLLLFRLTTQFINTLHWMWNTFLIVGTIFNPAKVNTVPCMCAAALCLTDIESTDGSLAYIENISEEYIQFVRYVEHTKRLKFQVQTITSSNRLNKLLSASDGLPLVI